MSGSHFVVGLSRPLNHGVDSVADRRWLAEVRRSEDNLMALWDRHSQGAKLKYHFYRGQHILRMLIMEFSADPRLAYFLEVDNSEGGRLSQWANELIEFYHLPYCRPADASDVCPHRDQEDAGV